MKYLQLIIISLATITYAQENSFGLLGKVIDESGKSIPYASVGLINQQKGTSTNQSGSFWLGLELDSLTRADTLVINVLGYKSFRKPVNEINGDLEITLEQHAYELKEIMITDLSAAGIVAKALKLRKKNNPTKKFKTQAFFRGLVRNDSTYVMMTEAQLNITDKGYHKLGDSKLYLNELKYVDERKFDSLDIHYDTLMEINEPNKLLLLDYMNWSFDKIDWMYSPGKVKYELDSITYFDNQPVFCVSVKTRKQLFNQVFIRMDDFAIIEARRGWKFAEGGKESTNTSLGSPTIDGKNSRVELIQYKKHQGKYYLSYVSLASTIVGGDNQKTSRLAHENARAKGTDKLNFEGIEYDGRTLDPDKNNYYRYDELLITHIYGKKEKVTKGQLMDSKKYVHRYEVPYNAKFWDGYNPLQLNPNLKRAKSHLKEAKIINTAKN